MGRSRSDCRIIISRAPGKRSRYSVFLAISHEYRPRIPICKIVISKIVSAPSPSPEHSPDIQVEFGSARVLQREVDSMGKRLMPDRRWCGVLLVFTVTVCLGFGQEGPSADQRTPTYQNMTPEQRAAATREFLGLGAKPDKEAAARGEPLFERNCAFCHGPRARGATGPSLVTSDLVLGDD